MQYTRLGNTGLIVSRLSFGAMTFGSDPSVSAIYKVDQENARAMIERSIEAGVNFFDTADMYAGGQSETMLGEALGARRQDVVIATKVGFRAGEPITHAGLSRRHILASCERSLKRLNTDYIDLYIVHKEDPFTPLEESLEALNDLVRTGKVRYLGYSNWSAWKAATALQIQKARGWAQFSSGQMYYSLVGRDVEHEVVPLMRYAGLGMTVWSPLAGGFLSGKYTRENLKDSENRLAGFDFLPFDKEAGFEVVGKMRDVAARHEASVAQIAIAWLLAKPVVSSVIVGASKLHQLEDNLRAADLELSDAEVAELDAITAPIPLYPNWFNANLADAKHKAAIGTERMN
ncbi:MAG: aldo/keto reductase [Blastocatellia bacterium]|nr:aldo/keto reductase [Blastocatellia bacterium]